MNLYVCVCVCVCVCVLVIQSCLTVCDSMDCSPPVSSVHQILQARRLDWVAILFSKESSQPMDRTQVSWIIGRFFIIWAHQGSPLYFPSFYSAECISHLLSTLSKLFYNPHISSIFVKTRSKASAIEESKGKKFCKLRLGSLYLW